MPTAGGTRPYPRASNLLANSRAGGQDFRAAASAPLTLCRQDDLPATHTETARNAVVRSLTKPMAMGRRVGLACAPGWPDH
ncbi:hypothetical protein [Hydrogenophaga sp. PAMC20947]|uniref:hypothetical protein n=1 Tax=Hydrogenophaga sp. PAMC20947 TaxID=2565558 RepID=UPI00109DE916|nr:hypothetical protein [Hydrogenophaga sp. PAMC20947]QCB48365.1 hypothetical protein E5678_21455 [Hydrogenophaga sp. PAMC20947]